MKIHTILFTIILAASGLPGQTEVKVYKLHPNHSSLFDENAIFIPARAKMMLKSPKDVEGATTLVQLYSDGWSIEEEVSSISSAGMSGGMDVSLYLIMVRENQLDDENKPKQNTE